LPFSLPEVGVDSFAEATNEFARKSGSGRDRVREPLLPMNLNELGPVSDITFLVDVYFSREN